MSIYPRTEYEMSESDLKDILEACKPVPYILIGGVTTPSQQENANAAWSRLGSKMGFDSDTVRPVSGKGQRFFTAVPSETDEHRQQRLARETEEKRQREIARLSAEIVERQRQLVALKATGAP